MKRAPKRTARTAEPAAPLAVAAKTCEQCHESKPRVAFWPTGTTNDKLTGKCKQCIVGNAAVDRAEREARQAEIAKRAKSTEAARCKTCITCKSAKPLSEFARHAQAKDGRRRSCKDCVAAGKTKRKTRSPKEIEAERNRRAKPHRREANSKAVRNWKERHPEAEKAMRAVRLAIKAGQLARPPRCQVKGCKFRGKLQGHHASYDFPLAVTWCCPAHHRRLHAGEKLELVNGLPEILLQIPRHVPQPDLSPVLTRAEHRPCGPFSANYAREGIEGRNVGT